ncbi:hypothetical protein EDD22DRAFT_848060 [Suillus occidentalis]|nr:hypothetical protein EDD22DRAFT_848060 [Suillus occidentalis]
MGEVTQRSHRACAGDGGVNHGNKGVDWAGGGSNHGFGMAQDCHCVVCSLSCRVKSLFTFVLLEFFDLPSDSDDIDQYLQQDLSIDHQHQLTEGLGGSSPHLNDLDLDGAYWLANPARLDLLKQHFSRHPRAKQIDNNSDWVADLQPVPLTPESSDLRISRLPEPVRIYPDYFPALRIQTSGPISVLV